jgi:TrmH family RNA methyltransferase
MIVVVGNETDGLSKAFKDQCDVKVRIPMVGTATSLNAAASGSILLYELLARD